MNAGNELARIRRRYTDSLPPPKVIHRDIDRLLEVVEAARDALEANDSARAQKLYDAVVVVLKDD